MGAGKHYDPMFRQACDLYNVSLESALRIYCVNAALRPGRKPPIQIGDHTIDMQVVFHGNWRPEEIKDVEFVSDYQIEGLSNRHHTYGLGVPLIAVRRTVSESDPAEAYYPPGLSFAMTAFVRVMPPTADGHTPCVLELHDPLSSRWTPIGPMTVPLETDMTTPLAYFLDTPEFNQKTNVATLGFLNPNRTAQATGIFMVEPYQPNKIPVLMVHGLWSSPTTWMEMFNDLRSFPEIRERYQFWFYLYPTGQPFWVSAAQLRDDLAVMRRTLDPGGAAPALNYMVLVGHSMGGLVSRLQSVDSHDDFWNIVSSEPFNGLNATPEERQELARLFYFQANPSIRRVITIGTPHRGSEFANDYTRWIGRKIIRLPTMLVSTNERVIRENPGLFRNTDLLTITTSIDSLAPDSPILPVILQANSAPWVRYHNIIGIVDDETLVARIASESDGVVSYASAHLDEAASEVVVTADHITVHQHPRSILEVRRILHENLQDFELEMGRGGYAPGSTARLRPVGASSASISDRLDLAPEPPQW
jgi:pimeloyl-ACP methyl ester carboxylesterase